jgi:sugar lactone lactonase YvrE
MKPLRIHSPGLSSGPVSIVQIAASLLVLAALSVGLQAQDYATPLSFSTLAGQVGVRSFGDGTGASALFNDPQGIAVDSSGNAYVADTYNCVIRKITPEGVVSTLAGSPTVSGFQDGAGSAALIGFPTAVTVAQDGTLYITDEARVRVITSSGVVSTLAGGATGGMSDGQGSAAGFDLPGGIAVDAHGLVYVADTNNDTIRTVSTTGVVNTLAGQVGQFGFADGTGASAHFSNPTGLALGPDGNLYVADTGNEVIRKVTPNGVVTTVAGSPSNAGDSDGTGTAARFYPLYGIAADASGNLYVTESNDTLRKVTSAGVVTTLAGSNGVAGSADGMGSAALFNLPKGVAVDAAGDVFVADSGNQTIRKHYAAAPTAPAIVSQPGPQAVLAGATATFSVNASGVPAPSYQWLLNGSPVANATGPTLSLSNVQAANEGSYSVTVTNGQGSVTSNVATLSLATEATPRLVNLSTRAFVGTGSNIVIAGFVVSGPPGSSEQVLVRGVGPTLASFGVSAVLANPVLTVIDSTGAVVASNTGWGTGADPAGVAAATTAVGAFTLPSGSADSAVLATLAPGAYTVEVAGQGQSTGIGLAEVYEVEAGAAQLVNISTRAFVGLQAQEEIAGFAISGAQPMYVLVRAVGPTLSSFGVSGVLAQPEFDLVRSGGSTVVSNTVWTSNPVPINAGGWSSISTEANIEAAASSAGAFALPTSSADSADYVGLNPGSYTEVVTGVGTGTGVALAEVYEAPFL